MALALRVWGIDWQLPALLHADEEKYALVAGRVVGGLVDQPIDYRNPSLFRHLLGLEYRLLTLYGAQPSWVGVEGEAGQLGGWLLLGRLTVALFSTGSVGLLFLVGRRMGGAPVGLVASALLAVNYLDVYLAHHNLNDEPASFFLVAALLPSVHLVSSPSGRMSLLAGIFSGLAAATKYNFGIVVVVPVAIWLAQAGRHQSLSRLTGRGLLLLGLGALIGFLLGMPEALWSLPGLRAGLLEQAALGDRRWTGQEPGPVSLLYARTLLHAFGLPSLLVALFGMVALIQRSRIVGIALLVGPLAYLAVMLGRSLFFARFALPLVPFLALFAAYGLVRLWSWAGPPNRLGRLSLAALGCALVLGPPALLAIRLDSLAGQTDTRVEATHWVLANLSAGTRLAAQSYSVPFLHSGDPLLRAYIVSTFDALPNERSLINLACADNRFILTSSFQEDRQRTGGRTGYQSLREAGELLATFGPGPDNTSVPTNIDDDGLPFWYVERYVRPGPTVRVFALPRPSC